MSLAEASQSRKDRLDALRRRRAGDESDPTSDGPIKVKQRNFDAETRTAKKFSQADLPDTVEGHTKGVAEDIIAADEARRQEELNLLNIAPKRANWDLKRDLDRVNLKLRPATDDVIRTIIRARLAAQQGAGQDIDLVGALDALADVDSDDEAAAAAAADGAGAGDDDE